MSQQWNQREKKNGDKWKYKHIYPKSMNTVKKEF